MSGDDSQIGNAVVADGEMGIAPMALEQFSSRGAAGLVDVALLQRKRVYSLLLQ